MRLIECNRHDYDGCETVVVKVRCMFHSWVTKRVVNKEGGFVDYIYGVVEDNTGAIHEVSIRDIRFVNHYKEVLGK
tara:strand:+ start:37 stop:264 length:228 start_codon:yes stop_codon:yes gene_type:complete